MARWVVTRTINAPVAKVFGLVADPAQFAKATPSTTRVEFSGDKKSGVGTRYTSYRQWRGKERGTDLLITEHVPNDHVRIVNEQPGETWDSTFAVKADGPRTVVTVTMDGITGNLVKRFMFKFVIHGMVQKAMEADMDAMKAYCER
jgi:carbon monoxide dehydrogenase subunit G